MELLVPSLEIAPPELTLRLVMLNVKLCPTNNVLLGPIGIPEDSTNAASITAALTAAGDTVRFGQLPAHWIGDL